MIIHRKVNSDHLALELNVSGDIIGQDLIELDDKGLLIKVYGAVFSIQKFKTMKMHFNRE